MKAFKIVKLIMQICSLALFLASLLVCSIDVEARGNATFMTMMASFIGVFTLASVGVFLLNAPANTPQLVGHGLTVSSYTIGLTAAVLYLDNSTAAIVMLVAVILLALYYLFALIVRIMQKSCSHAESPNDDIRIVRVKEWKQIMEEGIISPEEYEAKRCQLLGIKPADKKAKKSETPDETDPYNE